MKKIYNAKMQHFSVKKIQRVLNDFKYYWQAMKLTKKGIDVM
jgi:hypothetical protein